MTAPLVAGDPLEPPTYGVGRTGCTLVDGARDGRTVPVDAWFPTEIDQPGEPSVYELLPGVEFTAAAKDGTAVRDGLHPVVLWSHGRTGTRSSYVLLCEALAARGFVVIAPEHAGDALGDWLLGAAVDDATNETNRVGDARFVLDAVLDTAGPLGAIAAHADSARVAVAGHSYGGFTALALAGDPEPDPRVRAVAGLETLTRTIAMATLARIAVPTLLIVGAHDKTTPPETDAERAWAKLGARPAWRVDIERAGHQGCSDVGLYLELAPRVEGLPALVTDFITSMAADITGTAGDPWRPTVALHARALAAFLDGALDIDPAGSNRELDRIGQLPGVTIAHRTEG